MTLIKLKEKEGDPQSVANQLRALMTHFNRLVEDDGLVKRFWGHVRRRINTKQQGSCVEQWLYKHGLVYDET